MRAAYVCVDSGVPVFGCKGCSVHVQEMIYAFRLAGIQISLISNNVDGRRSHALSGIRIQRLPRVSSDYSYTREECGLAMNDLLPSVLESAGKLDFVYERHSLWSYAGIEWAASHGIPTFIEVNAPLIEEQMKYRQLLHKEEAYAAARRAFHTASFIIAVSKEVQKYVLQFSVNPQKVIVMTNGVNPFRFPRGLAPALKAPANAFTVGFLGSLKPWHGLSHLVDAFEILYRKDPRIRLLLIGDGPERKSLTEKLTQRNLTGVVHFTGLIPPSEVPRFLASIDVAVAPYPEIEGLYFSPIKVFEYMAAGLPIVVSDIGQLSEIIQNEVTGLVCPPGDSFLLARAIEKLRQSPDLRMRFGLAARAKALRDHTWSKNADRVLHLVDQTRSNLVMAGEA
jgi:glycosyltransferase involved in cell wall biosynthesis